MAKKDLLPELFHQVKKGALELKRALESYEEPYCEVSQNEKCFIIKLRMPAVRKQAIHLRITDGKKIEVSGFNTKKNYYKVVDIPPVVDFARTRALLSNGMLKITMPYSRVL